MDNEQIREVIFYGDFFWDFYKKQSPKVKKKINWTIGLLKYLEIIPEKYLKHIEETDLLGWGLAIIYFGFFASLTKDEL